MLLETTQISYAELEYQRKTRLFKVFCRVIIITTIISWVIVVVNNIATSKFNFIGYTAYISLLVISGLAYKSTAGRRWQVWCWILVTMFCCTAGVAVIYAGASVPLGFLFLIPILATATLLNARDVIILSVAFLIFYTSFIFYQTSNGMYTFPSQSALTHAVYHALTVILVIPVAILIYLLPLRGQTALLKSQNAQLLEAVKNLQERQRALEETSQGVLESASELKIVVEHQTSGSQQQVSLATQVNATAAELEATAQQIGEAAYRLDLSGEVMAGNSHQIVEITRQSASQSRAGLEAVEKTIAAGRQGAEYYRRLNYSFNELSARTTSVRRVLDLLKSITSETHLLALNASIEAAGAGTHGERFGVVAQEIKGLAARASSAQNEVVTLVEKIEEANKQAIEAVEAGFAKAHEIEATAQATGETIRQTLQVAEQAETQANTVNTSAQNLKHLSEVIHRATGHQRRAHEQVLASISELLKTIQQNSEDNKQIGVTVSDLEDLSGRLRFSLVDKHETVI